MHPVTSSRTAKVNTKIYKLPFLLKHVVLLFENIKPTVMKYMKPLLNKLHTAGIANDHLNHSNIMMSV